MVVHWNIVEAFVLHVVSVRSVLYRNVFHSLHHMLFNWSGCSGYTFYWGVRALSYQTMSCNLADALRPSGPLEHRHAAHGTWGSIVFSCDKTCHAATAAHATSKR